AAALHDAFDGREPPGLCPLADRYRLLGPATAPRERDGVDYIPKQIARGWELFADRMPADVVDAIAAVHAHPAALAAELERGALTVVHGDLNLRNIALLPD